MEREKRAELKKLNKDELIDIIMVQNNKIDQICSTVEELKEQMLEAVASSDFNQLLVHSLCNKEGCEG